MKKRSAIALAALAALTLASCNRKPTEPTVIDPTVPEEGEVATKGVTSSDQTDSEQTEEATPTLQQDAFIPPEGVVVTNAGDIEVPPPGVIPSTDASTRVKAIGKGRKDPFSGRVIIVRPELPDPAVIDDTDFVAPNGTSASAQAFLAGAGGASGSAASAPASRASSGAGSGRSGSSVAPGGAGSRSGSSASSAGRSSGKSSPSTASAGRSSSKSTPSTASAGRSGSSGGSTTTPPSSTAGSTSGSGTAVAAAPDLPDLTPRPPIPDPTTAQAVEVTGVVQIGSSFQAIVKAPDEPTSRYVSVGQRLSNGRVLVKRIESNGSEPVVILEEGGVEVVRAIGAPSSEGGGEEASA